MLSIILAAAVAAAATPAICARLSSEIEYKQMDMAVAQWAAVVDDSAPRATMRAAESTANWEAISVELSLMRDHHCAPYPHVVSEMAYFGSAGVCRTARTKPLIDGGGSTAKECHRETWIRLDD